MPSLLVFGSVDGRSYFLRTVQQLAQLLTMRSLYKSQNRSTFDLDRQISVLKRRKALLKEESLPLLKVANKLVNPNWGLVTRAGRNKSLIGGLIEQQADAYTSRFSNLKWVTPYAHLYPELAKLPHQW